MEDGESVRTERVEPVRVGVQPNRSLVLANLGPLDQILGPVAAAAYIAENSPTRRVREEILGRLGEQASLGFNKDIM